MKECVWSAKNSSWLWGSILKALASCHTAIDAGGCRKRRGTYKMTSGGEERRGIPDERTSLAKAGLEAAKDLVSKDVWDSRGGLPAPPPPRGPHGSPERLKNRVEFCGLIFAISTVQFYYQLLFISLLKLACLFHLASSKQDNVHEMRSLMCKPYIYIFF